MFDLARFTLWSGYLAVWHSNDLVPAGSRVDTHRPELRRCEIRPGAAFCGGRVIRQERPNSSTNTCRSS